MLQGCRELLEECSGEIVEKKSRFIANMRPVYSEEEANEYIAALKKKYWDARHNCYAFVIGDNNENMRCSDDGEPAQTAGRPMLEVLLGENLHNTVVVVTRYFGGTLLGTGGLVRAYQGAVKEAISGAIIAKKVMGCQIFVGVDYSVIGKVQYILGKREIKPINVVYSDSVVFELEVEENEVEDLKKELTEALNGNIRFDIEKKVYIYLKEN